MMYKISIKKMKKVRVDSDKSNCFAICAQSEKVGVVRDWIVRALKNTKEPGK